MIAHHRPPLPGSLPMIRAFLLHEISCTHSARSPLLLQPRKQKGRQGGQCLLHVPQLSRKCPPTCPARCHMNVTKMSQTCHADVTKKSRKMSQQGRARKNENPSPIRRRRRRNFETIPPLLFEALSKLFRASIGVQSEFVGENAFLSSLNRREPSTVLSPFFHRYFTADPISRRSLGVHLTR